MGGVGVPIWCIRLKSPKFLLGPWCQSTSLSLHSSAKSTAGWAWVSSFDYRCSKDTAQPTGKCFTPDLIRFCLQVHNIPCKQIPAQVLRLFLVLVFFKKFMLILPGGPGVSQRPSGRGQSQSSWPIVLSICLAGLTLTQADPLFWTLWHLASCPPCRLPTTPSPSADLTHRSVPTMLTYLCVVTFSFGRAVFLWETQGKNLFSSQSFSASRSCRHSLAHHAASWPLLLLSHPSLWLWPSASLIPAAKRTFVGMLDPPS